jgi:all-trans-retinol 13,14-reductase
MKFDVVIIGSGLGGLLCGNILSREGFSVCIIEKNNKLGGSLQTFGRKACIFNTGLNYTESLDNGQVLNQYFRYFGLLGKIKLQKLNEDGFDIISIKGEQYKLAMNHKRYVDTLLKYFPGEKSELNQYIRQLKSICSANSLYTFSNSSNNIFEYNSLGTGAANFIRSIIKNHRLQQVIAGNNILYAGHEKKTPLFIHAIINNSFIDSAWRIKDGSHNLVKILADNIIQYGGKIYTNAKAEKLISENKKIRFLRLSDGKEIEGKYFISNTHPEQILNMTDARNISLLFHRRIKSLEDTKGIFTLYLVFKKESFPYLNYNFYHYNQENVWIAGDYNPALWPQHYVFMVTATSKSESYAESASVLTYMDYNELLQWKNTTTGKRGEEYEEFKRQKAEKLLDAVEMQFPGIKSCVASYYTSTPLTWRDYTGTRAGSAYGVLKDFNKPLESIILPKTKISNLLLTGQNINVHGILGVTISSVLTCAEIIDLHYLLNKISSA